MSKQWTRREPSRFRRVEVTRRAARTPHLLRLTLAGPELEGFDPGLPAASVRLLVPSPGATELVMPAWNGNEFLLPDGSRPIIRTYTPLRCDPDAFELDLDVVLHPGGAVAAWAERVQPGDAAAVSGPGRGYVIDPDASSFVLAGDEAALPAIGQLIELLPREASVQVIVEIAHADARVDLPEHPALTVKWCERSGGAQAGTALGDAVRRADIPRGARIWVAGEAAAVQRIRKHLFDERAISRSQATVRGYWKRGREGDPDDA